MVSLAKPWCVQTRPKRLRRETTVPPPLLLLLFLFLLSLSPKLSLLYVVACCCSCCYLPCVFAWRIFCPQALPSPNSRTRCGIAWLARWWVGDASFLCVESKLLEQENTLQDVRSFAACGVLLRRVGCFFLRRVWSWYGSITPMFFSASLLVFAAFLFRVLCFVFLSAPAGFCKCVLYFSSRKITSIGRLRFATPTPSRASSLS